MDLVKEINPLSQWLEEQTLPGEGFFLGYKTKRYGANKVI